ncbi:hypothetical protein BUALT_Bualt07G0098900 [Buddleja alternifolia]|uniref:Late blight resistance protein homolog R1A-3 n=1 Tax=Buddleja alternifolia TaxID=168488 RepID=A0AAV6XAI2_9LAMI|nr:hypothetical protein BUALT_Bualt07G0098900 [Buddleja alternifolia]
MAAYTKTKKLLEIFRGRIEWKLRPDLDRIHWTHFYLSAAIGRLLEVRLQSDFYEPITTILWNNEEWFRWFWYQDNFENFSEMVASLTQELEELFMLPKPQQFFDNTLEKNEVVAAFIDFLVQLLSHGVGLIFPFEDCMNNLKEELRCLVVVLGDTSLLGAAEIEQVENLLAEFEAVANKAGSFVYSLFSATNVIDGTAIGALFEQIDLLKTNIIKFSNLPPSSIIKTDIVSPEAAAVDSFSIIVSLLRDLEEVIMNREDDHLIVNVKVQVKILRQGLMLSQSFLMDIKVLQLSEMEELKEVVMRIRDVAYESEYLINSFLVGDAPLWYLNIRIPNVIQKIKIIETGLQDIEKNYDIGALKVAKDFSAQLSLQLKRNSDVEDIIVGLEDKTIDILDQLTGGEKHLQIITIFGMPGLGKTTFAKKLYVHPTVNYYFDKLSWCILSQAYQTKSVLTDILICLESELGRDMIFNMEEEKLAEHIYKSLKGRRYLIVMDDVWHSNVWDDLRRYFPDDRNGSRILFTSRNKDVGPPNSIIHELPTLSNGQCWELLHKKVFGIETCPPQLLGVGNQIAVSCCGLPLAVVVVAGILLTMDQEKSAWENVGRSLASYIFADKNNSTMQILELSYKHLPDHLKPCFLYFGAFYEDERIPVRRLKRLWMAEGFICKHERKSLESVAEEYLMELIGKSLVKVTGRRRSDGGVKYCVIHDLLRDLCLRRAEEENFLKLVDHNYSIYNKHQRLYAPFRSVSLNLIYRASHLLLGHYGRRVRSFIGYLLMSPLNVVSMQLLRVLDCWNRDSDDLVGIETLVHLKYLAIAPMPASIASSLVNLEFLVVHGEVSISSSLLKLAKLRHLQAFKATFNEDCNSIQMVMNNLEYLSTICIFNLKDEEMLKCSPHLRNLKCKCEPFFIMNEGISSYRYPDLRFLTQLESLKMIRSSYGDEKVGIIKFPSNIKKLTLSGLRLPWKKMLFIGTLPNLEILKLEADAIVGEIWKTRDGEFQQLRFLKLERLEFFCQWDVSFSSEHFPKLQQLVLHDCCSLQEIPCAMGEIETLQLIEVDRCRKSVGRSATQIQEEQRDMTGNEDLRIIIKNVEYWDGTDCLLRSKPLQLGR